jgi:SAM-dependent methyltransferase
MTLTCPVCSDVSWRRDRTACRILALPDDYAVVRCATCGQRRLDPQLSPEQLDDLYSGAYFSSSRGVSGRLPLIKAAPTDYSAEVVRTRRFKFAKTLRVLGRLLPATRSLLDVGAATGDFVKLAREHGFAADGIEMSAFAVEQAEIRNSIGLRRRMLAEVDGDALYDCIHLNHVFEHFNDPVEELVQIRRLLRPDGVLYLEVPYQFQLIERAWLWFGRDRPEFTLHSLHHAFFYTPRTIERLLRERGFEVIEISVFDAERYEASAEGNALKKVLWQMLAALSIGNHIEIYARRSP